jgi:hypothetical protein
MEETKFTFVKKIDVSERDSQTLKDVFSTVELTDVLGKGRRESFRKRIFPEYGGWGVVYGAASERGALEGLKFVDESDLSEVKRQVDDLHSEVESVVSELQQCKEGISTLLNELREKPIINQTELFEIDETLEVIRPIPIVLEEYGDEVIASFPEIEAFGAGLCEAEAIIDLKNEIRKIFFELEEVGEEELGKLPLSWKRVLSKVVKKIGNAQ